MLALIIVLSSLLGLAIYTGVGGLMYRPMLKSIIKRCNCPDGHRRYGEYYSSEDWHRPPATVAAIFWLFTASFIFQQNHISRDEKRKVKEIADAEHAAKLRKIAADEAESLDRQLRATRR